LEYQGGKFLNSVYGSTTNFATSIQTPAEHSMHLNNGTSQQHPVYIISADASLTSSMGDNSAADLFLAVEDETLNERRLPTLHSHIRSSHNTQDDILFDHMDDHAPKNLGEYSRHDFPAFSTPHNPSEANARRHQPDYGSKAGSGTALLCTKAGCAHAAKSKEFANKASLR
jgi:hypothetical protein